MFELIFLILGLLIGFFGGRLWFSHKSNNDAREKWLEMEQKILAEKELRFEAEAELNAAEKNQQQKAEQMHNTFEAIATKTVKNNSELFGQLTQQTLDKYFTKAADDYEKRKQSIAEMLQPLKTALEKNETLVRDIEKNTGKNFGSLKHYLESLEKNQKNLEKETNALVTALKSPKIRGRWGEIGLKRLIEFSGMSQYCDFEEQVSINTEKGRLRPDMIVNLPGDKQIIIDSKVPLSAYLESLETDDEDRKKELINQHAKAVASHTKELGSKAYWTQFDKSVDFVVLYIEVESAFSMALSRNKNLVVDALQNRVVFATPTTLIALLQTVAFTWRQHNATQNALQIHKASKEAYERLATFSEHFSKVSGHLSTLVKTYNQMVGSWENRVIPGIRKMENLGVESEKKQVSEINPTDTQVRNMKQNR